jgi:LuxR family transcriptional regulator, maltose regulon positive regulatory protein
VTEIRLPAKLARPRAAGAIERQRLFALLDAQHDCSLVWIFGPPGSGKTNLITTYLDHNKCPTLWFRIDEGDRDAATFFSYLGEAVGSLKGKRGKNLPQLTPEYLLDVAGFSRRYFRELFAALPPGCTLVLDNFESASGALDKFLAIAALEVPPGMRLMVTSRTAPGDTLNHLTAKGVLGQLGWDDLRLTQEEAAAIQEKNHARLTESVESLHAMSDGWVAGFVVMLGHGHETGLANPKTVGAVRESLFAYFINEMFERADAATRDLLLKTAVMPSFTLAQAAHLCANTDDTGVLAQLTGQFFHRHQSGRRTGVPVPRPVSRLFAGAGQKFFQRHAAQQIAGASRQTAGRCRAERRSTGVVARSPGLAKGR